MPETSIAAGCVVIRSGRTEPEVLLIWTKRYPDPTLPKGQVETGESILECALREVKEETGYLVEAVSTVPIVLETVLDKHPPIVHKTTHWFLARVRGGSSNERTEKSLITRVGWLPVPEAMNQMRRTDEIQALERYMEQWGSPKSSTGSP